jgi:cytoskeletal protein CcmA (bactofilin family)
MSDDKEKETPNPDSLETSDDQDSLEGSETIVSSKEEGASDKKDKGDSTDKAPTNTPKSKNTSAVQKFMAMARRLNIYLLLFIFIIIIALMVVFIAIYRNKKEANVGTVNNQTLSQQALSKVTASAGSVGSPDELLTIQSPTIFTGLVTVKNDVDVAGNLQVGKALSIPALAVNGTGSFNQIQSGSLNVSGTSTFQGQLIAQKGLTVNGAVNFAGALSAPQLSVNNLSLTGDLNLSHHITTNGSVPKISNGAGAISSVSGTDTAGTVAINLSSNNGCFANVTFGVAFNSTPHIVISPDNSTAASLGYYASGISRTGFSICSLTASSGQAEFGYIAID